jgi:cysteinyl-tRNA synthetase
MNMPKALAVVWELLKAEESYSDKVSTIRLFDEVLGLDLFKQTSIEIPETVLKLIEKRKQYRVVKNYAKSDELRDEILGLGFEVLDEDNGEVRVKKIH